MLTLTAIVAVVVGCAKETPWDVYEPISTDPSIGVTARVEPPEEVAITADPDFTFDEREHLNEGILSLSLEQAVVLSLRNNRSLYLQQLQPLITGTFEDIERAVYDPNLTASARLRRDTSSEVSRATGETFNVEGQNTDLTAGLSQDLPTGTDIDLSLSHSRSYSNRTPDQHGVRVGLTVTQALLRGADLEANLARIRQARLDTVASGYQLRGFAESLVARVEDTYWQLALSLLEQRIFENSLELAEEQQTITQQRVDVGTVPETELAAARAEVARRKQELINAASRVQQFKLDLLQLTNPGTAHGWSLDIDATADPAAYLISLDALEDHLELGRRFRPEVHEAYLELQRNRLEVVQTRNGALPRLDFFITLGKSGFADSFSGAVSDIDSPSYDLTVGLSLEQRLGNRDADARHRRATLSRYQAARSIENLTQLIELDIRKAYVEAQRAVQQVDASRITRELQEEVLRTETARFRVGRSTNILVAQAQRDLLTAQIGEVEAAVNLRRAVVELYRTDGTLLLRRGIHAPGVGPRGYESPVPVTAEEIARLR